MESVGSLTLKDRIKEIQPRVHIAGHIHESFGQYTDGKTDYYNVSILNEQYQLENEPTIIEV
jgi:Icc-related predicted phosphoesterase